MSYKAIAEKVASRLSGFWTTKRTKREAQMLIHLLADEYDIKAKEAESLAAEASFARARVREIEVSSATIAKRALHALTELGVNKGHSPTRAEKAAAVIMSPYQYEQALGNGYVGFRGEKVKTLQGYPIYIASGMFGPVFVTQAALDGLSRQAPELNLRAP